MHQSKDKLDSQRAASPRGPEADLLDRLDVRLDGLYSVLARLAGKLQRLCMSINPILQNLDQALSHVDTAMESSLPALLQAIGRGGRQESRHFQAVHGLALQQQANVERVLTNVSDVFARICAAMVTALEHLLLVLQERAKLGRPPTGRGGLSGMEMVWQRARQVADQAASLRMLQRGDESGLGSERLREELGRFDSLLAMSNELADELLALAK
jgi:hypothetical protein